jgi:hypothetical protein
MIFAVACVLCDGLKVRTTEKLSSRKSEIVVGSIQKRKCCAQNLDTLALLKVALTSCSQAE